MSREGYAAALLARVLDPATEIRRRTVLPFEPEQVPGPGDELMAEAPGPAPDAGEPSQTRAERAAALRTGPPLVEARTPAAEAPARPARAGVRRLREKGRAAHPAHGEPASAPEARRDVVRRAPPEQRPVAVAVAGPARADRQALDFEARDAVRLEPASHEAPALIQERALLSVAAELPLPRAPGRPRRSPARRPSQPGASPADRASDPVAEAPPVVHVSIGRIEVRAAAPASAPRSEPPRRPAMDLAEYLRQRDGGER